VCAAIKCDLIHMLSVQNVRYMSACQQCSGIAGGQQVVKLLLNCALPQ